VTPRSPVPGVAVERGPDGRGRSRPGHPHPGPPADHDLVKGPRKPAAGTIRLFGGDPRTPASRVRLGSTPQETGLPPTLWLFTAATVTPRQGDPQPAGHRRGRAALPWPWARHRVLD